jgi:diguanylate cyclase (GGDEF)-like protein
VAERLRQAIKTMPIPVAGNITASIGVAVCPSHAQNVRDLMAGADAALYEAKRAGRDRVQPSKLNSAAAGDVQSDQQ